MCYQKEINYTSVSIAAVDLCGRRSNRVQAQLMNTSTVNTCALDPNLAPSTSDAKHYGDNSCSACCLAYCHKDKVFGFGCNKRRGKVILPQSSIYIVLPVIS